MTHSDKMFLHFCPFKVVIDCLFVFIIVVAILLVIIFIVDLREDVLWRCVVVVGVVVVDFAVVDKLAPMLVGNVVLSGWRVLLKVEIEVGCLVVVVAAARDNSVTKLLLYTLIYFKTKM